MLDFYNNKLVCVRVSWRLSNRDIREQLEKQFGEIPLSVTYLTTLSTWQNNSRYITMDTDDDNHDIYFTDKKWFSIMMSMYQEKLRERTSGVKF